MPQYQPTGPWLATSSGWIFSISDKPGIGHEHSCCTSCLALSPLLAWWWLWQCWGMVGLTGFYWVGWFFPPKPLRGSVVPRSWLVTPSPEAKGRATLQVPCQHHPHLLLFSFPAQPPRMWPAPCPCPCPCPAVLQAVPGTEQPVPAAPRAAAAPGHQGQLPQGHSCPVGGDPHLHQVPGAREVFQDRAWSSLLQWKVTQPSVWMICRVSSNPTHSIIPRPGVSSRGLAGH